MKRSSVFAVLLVLGAGCEPRSAAPPQHPAPVASPAELLLRLPIGLDTPDGTITFGDSTQHAGVGTYCWSRPLGGDQGVTTCADSTGENVLVDSYVEVPVGTVIRVDGSPDEISGLLGTATDLGNHRFEFDPAQELALADGDDVLRAEPGDYTLDLFVHWDRGDANLAFGIRLVAA